MTRRSQRAQVGRTVSTRCKTGGSTSSRSESRLARPEFAGAPRLARFLSFVVETTLAGNSEQIKESLVAIEVYGRRPDYDPQIDSTVRVEAGRLRARLREYQESSGKQDAVQIDCRKGHMFGLSFASICRHFGLQFRSFYPSHRLRVQRDASVLTVVQNPRLWPIRADPRFQMIVESLSSRRLMPESAWDL